MGNVARGHLRGGRSPPFLVAALFVGMGILGFSYYSLSCQFTKLQETLDEVRLERHNIIVERDSTKTLLTLKEEEHSQAKILLEQRDTELEMWKKRFHEKEGELTRTSESLGLSQKQLNGVKSDLDSIQTSKVSLEAQVKQLEKELVELKESERNMKTQLDRMSVSSNKPEPASPDPEGGVDAPKSDQKKNVDGSDRIVPVSPTGVIASPLGDKVPSIVEDDISNKPVDPNGKEVPNDVPVPPVVSDSDPKMNEPLNEGINEIAEGDKKASMN